MLKIDVGSEFFTDLARECENIDFSHPMSPDDKMKFVTLVSILCDIDAEVQRMSAKRSSSNLAMNEWRKLDLLSRRSYIQAIDKCEIVFRYLFIHDQDHLQEILIMSLGDEKLVDFSLDLYARYSENRIPFSTI